MLATDDSAAVRAMAALDADPRVHVFDDAASRAAVALAPLVGMPRMDSIQDRWGKSDAELRALFHPRFLSGPPTLFDTALVFDGGASWIDGAPPAPRGFVTQLAPGVFEGVPEARYFVGAAFRAELARLLAR
ncbi:MAG: hypothetical protein WD226_12645 [Planctomycetota bacterium]